MGAINEIIHSPLSDGATLLLEIPVELNKQQILNYFNSDIAKIVGAL